VDNNNNKIHPREQQQVFNKEMYQPKDRLDIEIELIRMLMVKMSQRRHAEERNIYINRASGKQGNNMKQVTREDFQRKSSGALQHKMWKPGELQSTTTRQHDNNEASGELQHKIWDPGGHCQ
jgi:hypothetical protein